MLTTAFPYRFVPSIFFFFLLNVWWRKLARTLIELLLLFVDFLSVLAVQKRSCIVHTVNINMLFFCDNKSLRSSRSCCHPKHSVSLFLGGFERKDDWSLNNCKIIKAVIRMKEKYFVKIYQVVEYCLTNTIYCWMSVSYQKGINTLLVRQRIACIIDISEKVQCVKSGSC